MQISFHPYQLQFKYPFKIAHGLRTHTNVVYVKLEHEGLTSWGEATLPPYLPETQQSVMQFLTEFSRPLTSASVDSWFEKLNAVDTNMTAKAALDMALWQMKALIEGKAIGELLGITATSFPLCTYTIGISSLDEMKVKFEEADKQGFEIFKLKLDGMNDLETVRHFKSLTNKAFAVDVNQGWSNVNEAIGKAEWLAKEGCTLLEQPFPKEWGSEIKPLRDKKLLPVYADEACQRLSDIERLRDSFDGFNIKLMKCGGITEAFKMINKARELNMHVLVGCMSESSVGCTAAAHLAALADYADLDGPYLIANDPFTGMKVEGGRVVIRELKQLSSV